MPAGTRCGLVANLTVRRARRAAHHLLDLVFPPRCVSCRRLGAWFCPRCRTRLGVDPLTACARCDLPLDDVSLGCPHCPMRQAGQVVTITTLGTYGGPLKDAIFALKYHRRHAIAPALADLLLPVVRPLLRAGDVLVPVPLHASRQKERGYNQAALLAGALADALALDGYLAVTVRADLVTRVRATADQTRLGPDDRRRNTAGAFALAASPPSSPTAGRVWLIDDVLTTGATVAACAAALRPLGLPIHALALARAPGGGSHRGFEAGRRSGG